MDKVCWLCGANGSNDPLERHHVFGGPLRDKSEQYGLTVWLCGNHCHRLGRYSVHKNAETARALKREMQQRCMKEQGWTMEDWHREFGKSYL